MKKYAKIILICAGIAILLYLAIWTWFSSNGKIPNGSGLDKSDWLQFLGGFLGFLGTTFLGIITLLQTNHISKQKILSEYRTQAHVIKGSPVLIVYDLEYNSESLETCVYLHDNYCDKHSNNHRYLFMKLPFSTDSQRIPDCVYINNLVIETRKYPEKRCNFFNCNNQFVPLFATTNNQFEIMIEISEDCSKFDFFESMIHASNDISIYLDMLFKIENVITPTICTLFLKQEGSDDKISDGLIQFKNSYFE